MGIDVARGLFSVRLIWSMDHCTILFDHWKICISAL